MRIFCLVSQGVEINYSHYECISFHRITRTAYTLNPFFSVSHSKRPQRHSDKVSVSGLRAPGSKPDSPEDPPCLMSPRWCDVEAWRGYQLRCRPCHLTTVQNDNVRPKNPRVSSELDVNVTKLNFRHFNLDEFIIGP
ncbi:hypothetical protein AVEN_262852-1 [Araneus ventricosus]|uniref:Uncharacterized protein n=1 Tax=Araneus ventricosus TaxID=182803 RepID=A0A4Y2DFX2_ARAVE|nr:hypothetical protein AVEN_262852-1 [Araneus ventricosus]